MTLHVLITGAASGLGKAMAKHYAARGADVCIADLNAEAGNEVVSEIEQAGGSAFFLPCDITQQDQIDNLSALLKGRWQYLDVLVNNAGVATAGGLAFEDVEQWQWVMNINVLGMVRMSKTFVPMLKAAADAGRHAHMINIASQAGITPVPMMASYNASKAAVVSFSETMHLELSRDNIHVSVACPSFFDTNLDKSLRSHQPGMQQLVRKMLSRSELSAEQVAAMIIDDAAAGRFMTITHKSGRMVHRMKRFLPTMRYLATVKKKTKGFGQIRD